jgi:hypothetical protein
MRRKMASLERERDGDVTAHEYAAANDLDEQMPVVSMLFPALDFIRQHPLTQLKYSELQNVAAQPVDDWNTERECQKLQQYAPEPLVLAAFVPRHGKSMYTWKFPRPNANIFSSQS